MRICVPRAPTSVGGPESFKRKLAAGLSDLGIDVTFDIDDTPYDIVLVVAMTKDLIGLRKVRKRGIPVVHRLDGFHWYSKTLGLHSKARWRDSARNLMTYIIRNNLADHVVYQSEFIANWWHERHGVAPVPYTIINNGVDTSVFKPGADYRVSDDGMTMVSVEGDYGVHERVARTPIDVWNSLRQQSISANLNLLGHMNPSIRNLVPDNLQVFAGMVAHDELIEYLQKANVFVSAEVNPPCPNSVIEALACGTPVVGFNTGALAELVPSTAGVCVEYGANPWKLEPPDINALTEAVRHVAENNEAFSNGARQVAVENYGLSQMVRKYVDVFDAVLGKDYVSRYEEAPTSDALVG